MTAITTCFDDCGTNFTDLYDDFSNEIRSTADELKERGSEILNNVADQFGDSLHGDLENAFKDAMKMQLRA
jgi:hypothetical protein